MDFLKKLKDNIAKNNSLLCIGLDTDIEKLPPHIKSQPEPIFTFNKIIIDSTQNIVCCYKINIAFYLAFGTEGLMQLKKTIDYIHNQYTNIPVILDAKWSDIGNTTKIYAQFTFEYLSVDAVTINPYLGSDSIEPFLNYKEKGIIIVCRSSNPKATDFQNLQINNEPLYIKVAKKVVEWNSIHNNCLIVVGPADLDIKLIREIAPNMFFLVPGIGAQGGNLQKTLEYGLTKDKSGLIIHSARRIIYASSESDLGEKAQQKAQELRDTINKYR